MEVKVLSTAGKEVREVSLEESVFAREVSEGAIYHAIRNELANDRVGTASTKTRGHVRYGGRKPWRQKGTGHARAGDKKSPIWVGGGTVFGPQPRDYHIRVPRKLKRMAMRSILSGKARGEELKVVEDFSIESGKTRDLVSVLKNLVKDERTVVVLHEDDAMLKRAGRNIPWLKVQAYNRLSAHEIFYSRNLVMTESAATLLNDFYSKNIERGRS